VWVIRNGINDLAQDVNTDFNTFHKIGTANAFTANGNGAVSFKIAANGPGPDELYDPEDLPPEAVLVIAGGFFDGSEGTPKIGFTTAGYEGTAGMYYAVTAPGADAPAYTAYTGSLDPVEAGKHEGKQISLPGTEDANYRADGSYDIYVVILKGGNVSAPIKVNTTADGEDVDWIWGDKPYKSYYVASAESGGNNDNPGTRAAPVATVQKALAKLGAAYTTAGWPGKGTEQESPAMIVILDEVPVTSEIIISNNGSIYPPIVLTGDTGAVLKAQAYIKAGTSTGNLLHLSNGAKVTLEGALILEGTGAQADDIRGLYVETAGVFTMKGGKISGNSSSSGGGVYSSGTFTMNGGEMSSPEIG
jgi:hypothetical protein